MSDSSDTLYDIRLNGKPAELATSRRMLDDLVLQLQKKLGGSWQRISTSLELPSYEQVDSNGEVVVLLDVQKRTVSSGVLKPVRV